MAVPWPLTAGISAARHASPLTIPSSSSDGGFCHASRDSSPSPLETSSPSRSKTPPRAPAARPPREGRPPALRAERAVETDAPPARRGVQPDVEGEPPRARHLLAPERAEGAAVQPADELAAQVPVEQGVLAVRGPGLPPRRLGRHERA